MRQICIIRKYSCIVSHVELLMLERAVWVIGASSECEASEQSSWAGSIWTKMDRTRPILTKMDRSGPSWIDLDTFGAFLDRSARNFVILVEVKKSMFPTSIWKNSFTTYVFMTKYTTNFFKKWDRSERDGSDRSDLTSKSHTTLMIVALSAWIDTLMVASAWLAIFLKSMSRDTGPVRASRCTSRFDSSVGPVSVLKMKGSS